MTAPHDQPRVLVTGLGLFTCLGTGRESSWAALKAGRHGCAWLDDLEPSGDIRFAGFRSPDSDHRPRTVISSAVDEAIRDAGLDRSGFDPDRAACVLGMSKGDLSILSAWHRAWLEGRPSHPIDDWTLGQPSAAATWAGDTWNLRGPRLAPIAACATGLIAAIQAADLIRRGVCDLALAGAGDASLDPLVLGSFRRMGALAKIAPGEDPAGAVRPWDRNRSGFLVGEGAGVLVLEREDHARARGARPYCEFAGGVFGGDAYHMTDLDPDPSNLAGLIGRALDASATAPEEIDHVNVHGTATRSNDPLECQALRLALGRHAESVSCSANKPQVGHCLGAAGAVELGFTALAVRDQFAPPTLNLRDPDPLCDLDATPDIGRPRAIRAAIKLSLGFGGHLAAAALRRYDGHSRRSQI